MIKTITYQAIGTIYSDFTEAKGTPIQPLGAENAKARIELFSEFSEGLKDLEGFSHIILLYHFHLSKEYKLVDNPYLDNDVKHGVFAMRAPSRPNNIGLSIVKLNSIKDHILYVQDIDIINETPLLDIKPYVPGFDLRENAKIGWLEKNVSNLSKTKADNRFK